MSVLVVTGTGTGVGKTVVTAAVAALALARGDDLAVVKPAQTGVAPDEPGDLADVVRLSGLAAERCHEPARFPDPLSPEAAARVAGAPPVDLDAVTSLVRDLAGRHQLVLVEGAGGLLVRYDAPGRTVADLAGALGCPVLVVVAAGLGTLNHTALTLEALARRGLALAGLVVGSWPAEPDLADRCNVGDLETLAGRPLAGAVPGSAGALDRGAFLACARDSLAPALGGQFDAAEFRRRHATYRRVPS